MKILQICNKSPYPAKEGGPIAMNAVSESLIQLGHEVKILALNTPKYPVEADKVDNDYKERTYIEWCSVDTSFSIKQALICLLKNKSYHVARFYNQAVAERLQAILCAQAYDVVILETVYMSDYISIIRQYSQAKIVLRAHNVENMVWHRVCRHTSNIVKRAYLSILAHQLEQYEKQVIPMFDAIWAISGKDALILRTYGSNKVHTLPFAMSLPKEENSGEENHSGRFFSIGSMDWAPNKEGMKWFIHKVWPDIHQAYPQLMFRMAGRNMPSEFYQCHVPNVEVIGEVPDALQFMMQNDVLVVPLFSGSGIRIKIIEAMSLAKFVITTSIGAEGLDVEHQKQVLIADTPQQFLQAVSFYLQHVELCQQIGRHAQQYVRNYHDYKVVNGILSQLLAQLA